MTNSYTRGKTMRKNVQQVLREQALLDFKQQGLDSLIAFFMEKYPNFPYAELSSEQILPEYLTIYDIPFLASYIRYSDRHLLGSGMRDEVVKEKLCYLHLHIGTILPSYRKFIWSDEITIDDLQRWLPLLSNSILKDRIMKCTKINADYKQFIDLCLDFSSFAYQNLMLLEELYPKSLIELDRLFRISNQETFCEMLKVVKEFNISISYEEMVERFFKIQKLLEFIPRESIAKYHFIIEEYLSAYSPAISPAGTLDDFDRFCNSKREAHINFLKNEFDMFTLKNFYCQVFLGIPYTTFKRVFPTLPNDYSEQYQLLLELYEARFPLMLKDDFYQRFSAYGYLKPYFQKYLLRMEEMETLSFLQQSMQIDGNSPLVTLQNSKFYFIASPLEAYQSSEGIVSSTVYSDTYFPYQEECLLAYSSFTLLSSEKNTCVVEKKDLKPQFLVAFDFATVEHLKYQKMLGLPIVIIDTETYAEKLVCSLEKMYANGDWNSYIIQKRNLFLSIQNHPWLFTKYFTPEALYKDVKIWMEKLEDWATKKLPSMFIRREFAILEQLIALNGELEVMIQKKTSSQYQKNMLQYRKIEG